MNMENPIVIITGATGELGRVVSAAFTEHHSRVIAVYRNEEKFKKLQSACPNPENLSGIAASVTDEDSVNALYNRIAEQYGKLDALLHLAGGFWMGGDISATPLQKWQQMIDLNLLSTFLCTRGAFGLMKETGGGAIVTVSAASALELPAGMASYAVSKQAVLSLTRVLAKEGRPYGIRANTLLPGIIDTEANRRAMPNARRDAWTPPGEIARVLLTLVSEEMGVVSGSTVMV